MRTGGSEQRIGAPGQAGLSHAIAPDATTDMPGAGHHMDASVLKPLVALIRGTVRCLDAAIFEYGPSRDGFPNIGRFATLSGGALSSTAVSMIQASAQALTTTPGCFEAGRYSDQREMRHVVGLRFSDGHYTFSGGYVVFREAPGAQAWSLLQAITASGAQIILAARKMQLQQRTTSNGQDFQNRMFEGVRYGSDAYWQTDVAGVIRDVVIFPFRPEAAILKRLEGRNLSALLASAQGADSASFHDLHVVLNTLDGEPVSVAMSGRVCADGTVHGAARLPGDGHTQTPAGVRSLIDKLSDAHKTEASLRREAEYVLDGLAILTSGGNGRQIFHDLLDLLGPALEFRSAVILQREWSGQIVAAAASSAELLAIDWTDVGEHLFNIDDVAATLAVPENSPMSVLPSGGGAAHALCVKLKGGSKPALLLCLHDQADYFGARHLGLGTRLSLVASQAFIHEEERQRVVESSKLASIGEMAAGIVHEINQPLTSVTLGIYNLLTLIERGRKIEPEQFSAKLTRLRGQVERITKIVASMRVLARRSDGVHEPFSLDTAIGQAVELAQHKLTGEGIELELSICEENAIGNALEFGQVMLNLLTNAHDAILESLGGKRDAAGTARVMVTATAVDQEWLEIIVRDTGCGFPEEAVDHAFEAFATTKAPGKGTGLGLTLCRRIMENMGGTITARNWSGGAEICVRLKRSPASQDGAA